MNRKCTIKNKVKIIEEAGERYVLKKSNSNLRELFDYLDSRSFYNHPKILGFENDEYRYEYIDERFYPDERKGNDIIEVVSNLHYKTSYYKDVSKNKYREIYEKISDNIDILKKYFNDLINEIENEIYPSPSHYFIERNYSIINSSLNFCERELKTWFKLVENKKKERVAIIHNNLKTEHYLRSDNGYLINWDKYVIDTPILDLYKFYQNDGLKYDFLDLLEEYNQHFKLSEEEKKLFFILISIPKKIENVDNELLNVKNIKNIFDQLYNTRELVTTANLKEKETK